MKKIIFLVCIMSTYCTALIACDICGCGVGNNYIGILPDFNKHIFGLRYRYNSVLTHLGEGSSTTYLSTHERYRTLELWGGWNIGKNFRLVGAVPYSFNERLNQGSKNSKDGFGDISFTGYYQVINTRKTVGSRLLVQSLWVGGGVKIPTGKYNPGDKQNTTENANLFQLGTGSTDFTLNAMYDIRLQDAGINASGSFKKNTTNRHDYRYGDKISLNMQGYYKIRILQKSSVAPNAGFMVERGGKDSDQHFPVDISGGNLLFGTVGIELKFNKISVGGNFQHPFSQNLADGLIRANNRVMTHVSFLL